MALATGTRLGPYEILGLLGAGGMGEVYRARDPRLGRDVAVKVLPEDVAGSPERLQRFEREARAVAALNHPNILTVFDVGTHEATPYVVMELLEGETLRAFLSHHDPTPRQVLSFAVQAARGLEAAHAKGILHRDVKPENLFVTSDGRVKLLDFGLAKLTVPHPRDSVEPTETKATGAGQMLGTLGYMSPEQVRGLPLDARTDVFSFGVVLYELLSGKHPFWRDTPVATLTAILEETPPELSSTARHVSPQVAAIVGRCLEKPREERFASGHDLVVALEAVAAGAPALPTAVAGLEERSPYPGLMSFTEKDAGIFFGREAEVKALWERLESRKLLAVIGPSGAGKTSFLRAGIIPAHPDGWAAVCATPGSSPALGLARALIPELAGGAEAIGEMLGGVTEFIQKGESDRVVAAVRRWRSRYNEALLVVDQFEELFTLNPEEVQRRFAALLGRLAHEADVHVLLSLRDDFLMRCHEQPALAPVFTELTPLGALTRDGLKSALVGPAKKRAYRFEDDVLVGAMVESVEGARGALPLLAFAVARLWEKRDRERKVLTREAYEQIGGVAGALAQHAEATMDRIGVERQLVVREIFRNLVTAQGTRSVVERGELLSVCPDKRVAEEVLWELIDARLVTSYEVEGREGEPGHHRIEVVHESLLKAWPRLVRWQAQDEEGAVLRDQLKQAAHLWEEKGRPHDLLWSGSSFQEYQVWRDRYPGGLSAVEEQFANAMVDLAGRQRRRRQVAVAGIIAVLMAGLVVVGSFWRRSATEVRQREAAQLLSLGRLRLADKSNAALAYAIASLERSDNDPARHFAVEALAQGPPALYLSDQVQSISFEWSPEGECLAVGGFGGLVLVDRKTGRLRRLSSTFELVRGFASGGRRLVTSCTSPKEALHVWTLPEGRLERTLSLAAPMWLFRFFDGHVVTFESPTEKRAPARIHRLALDGSSDQVLGTWPPGSSVDLDSESRSMIYWQAGSLFQQRLEDLSATARRIGSHEAARTSTTAWTGRGRAVTSDDSGLVRIWDVPSARLERTLRSPASALGIALDPKGRFLATGPGIKLPPRSLYLFDLTAPRSAEPTPLLESDYPQCNRMGFSPDGAWLGTNHDGTDIFWSMGGSRAIVLGRQDAERLGGLHAGGPPPLLLGRGAPQALAALAR